MVTPFTFILLSLACYRLSRLWLFDVLFDGLRHKVLCIIDGEERPEHNPDGSVFLDDKGQVSWHQPSGFRKWLNKLLTCQWCFSVWVALGLSLAWTLYQGSWTDWTVLVPFVVLWMALAAATTFWFLIEDVLLGEDA